MDLSCSRLSCVNTKQISTIKVLAFGNLLLNYNASIDDPNILRRHRQSWNKFDADVNFDKFSEITSDININESLKVELSGSALRTVRALRQLGTEAIFFSACGDDQASKIISRLLKMEDMDRSFLRVQTVENVPTGRRVSLSYNDSRALYTNCGASAQFSVNFLEFAINDKNSSILRPENRVQIFYIEGYFIPKREAVTTFIVRSYIQGRRYIALNLSAEHIVRQNFNHLLYIVSNALFVFGNSAEFHEFCECWGASSTRELAEGIVKNKQSPIIFVINKGADGIDLISNYFREGCAPGPLTFQTFNVPPSAGEDDPSAEVSDACFVAGFLHAWLQKKELSQCVRVGCHYAAKGVQPGSGSESKPTTPT
ncbi:uncharacterized protein LOC101890231 [Musca domestica]|uniref:Adenosine kinase n=1 Tax=Musca domestica TaxID=7370 RepID=A0A1I8MD17_MUSDO|nr:uncharacterized protein LOC101890231 [Musca domestica]